MEWTYRFGSEVDSVVRALVAETYGVEPARVELPRKRGAPEARIEGQRIEVSRSRSQGYVAAACAGPSEKFSLGIDIEAVRPFLASATEPRRFAEVVLAPEEIRWFLATGRVAEAQRLSWLLRTWVRKEAVLKSLHTGFDTSRGGMPPTAVVLNEPWEAPACLSHALVTLTDLPTRDDVGDSGPVMLALAQNTGPVRRPRR
ncbi:4'-phosphopantetheinyl transferase superfamily protein [Nesterenkonia sp. AY15]|uniref:4'-phosphopantetheinyl transferase family protein n=1 Tax=Nesterenkonia sp. AY15 TaxID=2901139 RepID=UPI001F4C9162|nr:4'-phosphopantetheinyl transferase superfamily protein [Nesterenkonia sp. AY15]